MIDALRRYFTRHMQAGLHSFGNLWRSPLASLMTIGVIGIAIALPAFLYVVSKNVQALSANWDYGNKIALFLAVDTTQSELDEITQQLTARADITQINYISPEQAMADFEAHTGLGNLAEHLPDNPLPGVLEIYPAPMLSSPDLLQYLIKELDNIPKVEASTADVLWIQRLEQITYFMQRGVWALIILLAIAVLLIVSNTIRLVMQDRHTEIEIFKLIGATNGFVRRPYLYTGMFYSLLGSVVALMVVGSLSLWLHGPLRRITDLYYLPFTLQSLGFQEIITVLLAGAALGWAGAYIVVNRHIQRIEPK